MIANTRVPLLILAALTVVLPVLLIVSAFRTYAALDEQKDTYLRSRAAAIAARLETLAADPDWRQTLLETETGVVDAGIVERESSPTDLSPLWAGAELFRTERTGGTEPRFRAWVPFHVPGSRTLKVARIDLDARSADFLVEHATHHLWIVAAGAAMILALSLITIRSVQAAARAERRRMEMEHLAQLGEMSAVLAHEIRNPLGTIKGFAQLLGESKGDGGMVAPILAETERLERLVSDLLAYGRPAQPAYRQVDSREIGEWMGRQGSRHPERLECEVEPVTVETDAALLEQGLLNLLNNALEATESMPDGKVRFVVRGEGATVVFRVEDNGPGLSAEAQRHLFRAFHTTKASGTGLGLSITRRLAQSLGGTLEIDNRRGGGAAAEIRLPLARKG